MLYIFAFDQSFFIHLLIIHSLYLEELCYLLLTCCITQGNLLQMHKKDNILCPGQVLVLEQYSPYRVIHVVMRQLGRFGLYAEQVKELSPLLTLLSTMCHFCYILRECEHQPLAFCLKL